MKWHTNNFLRTTLASALAVALAGWSGVAFADKGSDHRDVQTFLGVSGSTISVLLEPDGSQFCFAGTLGGLVQDNAGVPYILSNNHVIAQVNGNANVSDPGEPIIQPALLDQDVCGTDESEYTGDVVGNLTAFVPINFASGSDNMSDAAIAAANSEVDLDGRILDIGGIQGTAVPVVGMVVQKSGRTTGHTRGGIAAVDFEGDINYGAGHGTAKFVGQFVIGGSKGPFIKGGDSGSLLVSDPDSGMPAAVGLLFAGSVTGTAIANPIGAVLNDLHLTTGLGPFTMVDCMDDEFAVPPVDCSFTGVIDDGGGNGGGGGNGNGPPDSPPGQSGAGGPQASLFGLDTAREARDRHQAELMANSEVVGTALSFDENGEPEIQVYTKSARMAVDEPIPHQLNGVNVRVVVTGEFTAY